MKIISFLLESANKPKRSVSNYFKDIGFDGEKPRLGWVIPPLWGEIEKSFREISPFLKNKEKFIFLGMGGSINGAKAVSSLDKYKRLLFLDNLDPENLKKILKGINLRKTLVIPISKSGSTLETQFLAKTLRRLFERKWRNHFLWLSDYSSFKKIDNLGWKGSFKFSIQVNGGEDIGGRFSSPHTLVFLLPLFIIFNQDIERVKRIFFNYLSFLEKLREEAGKMAFLYRKEKDAFLNIKIKSFFRNSTTTWITQLFQESLGSKDKLSVKTTVGENNNFLPISFPLSIKEPILYLMGLMYFLEVFIAVFSYYKRINFVSQPYVEEYKRKLKELKEREERISPLQISFSKIPHIISSHLNKRIKFVEVVLYAYLEKRKVDYLRRALRKAFPSFIPFVFIGSDWNHHSYQASFLDKNTFYLIGIKKEYEHDFFEKKILSCLKKNIDLLRKISFATYFTLQNKSLIFSF